MHEPPAIQHVAFTVHAFNRHGKTTFFQSARDTNDGGNFENFCRYTAIAVFDHYADVESVLLECVHQQHGAIRRCFSRESVTVDLV